MGKYTELQKTKKPSEVNLKAFRCLLAEMEGFEPPVPHSTLVFKTSAFDHSATSLFFKIKLPNSYQECHILNWFEEILKVNFPFGSANVILFLFLHQNKINFYFLKFRFWPYQYLHLPENQQE